MSRVIPGILMAGGWLLLLFLGSAELFGVIVAVGACLALYEFFRMAITSLYGWRLFATIGLCLFPALAAFSGQSDMVLAGVIVSLLVLSAVALQGYGVINDVFKYVSYSGFACVYISLCLAHIILIRFLPEGALWLTMLVGIVAGSDTGAYYAGRAFGERKLFPRISPKKTVAGAIGGLVAGVAAAEIINLFFPEKADPLALFFVTIVLVIIGIGGDLTESMIKRSFDVKDSGTLLSGHGGLLDRIDSLLLAGPVLYYLLHFGIL
jgi:phosphatidate cytidylyltransferase